MSVFGCSGGKHSKYCPIWLEIEIHTPHYICYLRNQICAAAAAAHHRHGGGFVKSRSLAYLFKQFNCACTGKLLKNPCFLHIRSGWRRRKTNFADSICSEELIFQFSAKSDNIYYVFPQNSQIPSLSPPFDN